YIISTTNKWSGSLTNITEDKVLVLQYERIDNTEYTLSVVNGVGSGTFTYNDLVNVQAAPTLNGEYFNYWQTNDKIVSYDKDFTFTIFNNTTIEAVYKEQPAYNLPLVTISNDLELRTGYKSFLGQFNVPTGYELIEYGMITSLTDEVITLSSVGINIYQGFNHVIESNEWLVSFNATNHTYIRAYLIVKNSQDELLTVYSGLEVIEESIEYVETFSNIDFSTSSYVSGTFTGDNGIFWTYQNLRGDYTLDGKAVMFANQASHSDGPSTLSATIDGGITSFYAELEQAFTGSGERTLGLFINGVLINEFTYDQGPKGIQIWTVENINVSGTFTLEIRHTAPGSVRGQLVLDNLTWASFGSTVEDPKFLLQLESNKDVSITVSEVGSWYANNTSVTLTAPEIEDYVFMHWVNVVTEQIESMVRIYTFDITNHTYLRAVYGEDSDEYTLLLDSNIAGDHTYKSHNGPYSYNELVSIEAATVSGYDFLYWKNIKTDHVYAYEQALNINMLDSYHLRAMYQEVETLSYITDFTGASKSSYSPGNVTLNGSSWTFDQAIITTVGSDSVARINPGGFIQTQFSTLNPTKITFDHFLTSSGASGSISLEYSLNGTIWRTFDDTITSNNLGYSITEYDLDLMMLWEVYNLEATDVIYFRIVNLYSERIELNQVSIHRYDNFIGYPLYDYESTVLTFNFNEPFTTVYSLGDTWSPNTCIANDIVLGALSCDVSGFVDTSQTGSYIITYRATDSNGVLTEHRVQKDVLRDATLLDLVLDSYYMDAQGLYGEALLIALRDIINTGFTGKNYGDSRDILQLSDRDPLNASSLILIYRRTSVLATWDDGSTWNREHVWPQSLFPGSADNNTVNIGSDLHNLAPANPSENSSRSNKYFDWTTTTESYAPEYDESRGYVSRALFYMVVMYDYLTLVNAVPRQNQMANLDTLVSWHFLYGVTPFEENRNDVLYTYQGNRNPFIDYAHFLELIWFDHENIPIS
ncbi:MAG: endonuclease, partial [Candidatus Izemoplasmataceae bacterium]